MENTLEGVEENSLLAIFYAREKKSIPPLPALSLTHARTEHMSKVLSRPRPLAHVFMQTVFFGSFSIHIVMSSLISSPTGTMQTNRPSAGRHSSVADQHERTGARAAGERDGPAGDRG